MIRDFRKGGPNSFQNYKTQKNNAKYKNNKTFFCVMKSRIFFPKQNQGRKSW